MKNKKIYFIIFFIFVLFANYIHAFENIAKKTPDDVYVLTEELIINFEALRKKFKISKTVKQPEYKKVTTADATIMQAYKVLEQVGILQKKNGLPSAKLPKKPTGKIVPKDVYNVLKMIISEYKTLDGKIDMPEYVRNNTSVKGKTPSDVYQQLVYAERLLISINESYK